jgi:hypothetical protein
LADLLALCRIRKNFNRFHGIHVSGVPWTRRSLARHLFSSIAWLDAPLVSRDLGWASHLGATDRPWRYSKEFVARNRAQGWWHLRRE